MAGTENVTVLFTDLVGSTELASSIAPEAADELRRKHFSSLRQAVAASGGTEVKNLGDGLMVVFPAASAALGCAVTMQQAVHRDNTGAKRPLGLRVGLSSGEATRENEDYFGDPVIEAARLCARASAGHILASDLVRANAGRRSSHIFTSLGALELKGLPEPIETLDVGWEPLGADAPGSGRVPLPTRLAHGPAIGMIGRENEIALLDNAVKRVGSGEGRELILVAGEPGQGKTTLVSEVARRAHKRGMTVLFGHCEEDLSTPYQLFAEALGQYVTHAPEDYLRAHIAAYGSELVRLVPALGSRIPDTPARKATDADSERFQLFAAVVGLLTHASQHQPVNLVFDDLQWADRGSLQLLRHLISAEQAMNLLVLGTYRDTELSKSHPLLETLALLPRSQGVSRIGLAGLGDIEIVAFMEAAAGHRMDNEGLGLAHALYRETDGNPFFVGEVLRHLSESGSIFQDTAGQWVAEETPDQLALPESIREVIGARVGRLGERAGRVLSLAAVIGRDFDIDLLARASESTEDEVLDILEEATSVALVQELADITGRFSFAHALIQHTLYEDLGPTRRARAHRRVAEALEDLCGEARGNRAGELAHHWFSATQPIDLTKAIDYARQAGDAALAALAPADALRYYSQGIDLYRQVDDTDPLLGLDLAIGLGTAQRQSGDAGYRDTLIEAAYRASELGDNDRLVAAALANDRGVFTSALAIDTEKVEVLEKALECLGAQRPERALVLATLCAELAMGSSLDRRRALADEAVAIARSVGDDIALVRVLNNLFIPLLVPSLHVQAMARTADALARAQEIGDPLLIVFAAMWRAIAVIQDGNLEDLDDCLAIYSEMNERLDQPFLRWGFSLFQGLKAQILGDTDAAERRASEALQIGTEAGLPDVNFFFTANLPGIALQRGTLGELIPLVEQMAVVASESAGALNALLAAAHLEAGHVDEAHRLLREFVHGGLRLRIDQAWLGSLLFYAEIAAVAADSDVAGSMMQHIQPWGDQFCTVGVAAPLGPVSYYLGGLATILSRYDDANGYYTQSSLMCDRIGAKFFGARTDLMWAKMLRTRQAPGDLKMAQELLVRSRSCAFANGYAGIERRTAELIQKIG
jgi:class 3 adenylate cyclase